jgi:hypothetical protein
MEVLFENKGSRYSFDFTDYKLKCDVSRISARDGHSICRLMVTTYHKSYNPHILGDNFNLTSSRSRTSLAKDLAARYHPKDIIVDWPNILEYISQKSVIEYEKGEPFLEICSTDAVGELEYLIDPIAPKSKPTIIFGDPGAGKSQLIGILNTIMMLPWEDNDLRLIAPNQREKCGFLDYEADADDMRRFLSKLASGMGLPPIPMLYRHCDIPLIKDMESIGNYIDHLKLTCLMVDSASLASGGDLNSMQVAQDYIRACRQLRITTISLAHTSKDRESKAKTILGSVLFEAGARSVWECRGQEDEEHNSFDIALFHRKSNLSKKSKPLGYRISYTADGNVVQWHDPSSVPEFLERMSANKRILDALKHGKLSTKELVEKLSDLKRSTIDGNLKRLKDAGVISGDSNSWNLTCKMV